MTTETGTPLQRLISVLSLGSPSVYRDHTNINGESMYFPTGRVYGGPLTKQSQIKRSGEMAILFDGLRSHNWNTNNISLRHGRGEIVSVVGPSGRGTTARLNQI